MSDEKTLFRPQAFEVSTLQEAMSVILTPAPGASTNERWEKETPYLVADIGKQLHIGPETTVLDYGCGVGRIAKGLIESFGCRVVGVDFSQSMHLLAPEYVLSEHFTVWSPTALDKMAAKGFRADVAISLWVIQHVYDPNEDLQRLARSVRPGGQLYFLNQRTRCLPSNRGWVNDHYDLRAGICAVFQEEQHYTMPIGATTPYTAATSMIQVLRNRA